MPASLWLARTVLPTIAPYGVRLTALSVDKTYRRCSRARLRLPHGYLSNKFEKEAEPLSPLGDMAVSPPRVEGVGGSVKQKAKPPLLGGTSLPPLGVSIYPFPKFCDFYFLIDI